MSAIQKTLWSAAAIVTLMLIVFSGMLQHSITRIKGRTACYNEATRQLLAGEMKPTDIDLLSCETPKDKVELFVERVLGE